MNSLNDNYYFLQQESDLRWYLYAIDSSGDSDRVYKTHPVEGFAYLTDAMSELKEAWADIGCDMVGMDVYELGHHVAEVDLRKHKGREAEAVTKVNKRPEAETRPYPSVDFPNELLSSKAGR